VPAEEEVARLLRLLERMPGRHTPCAQFNLGVKYENGEDVLQDYVEAVKWYRLATDQGDADARFNPGVGFQMIKFNLKIKRLSASSTCHQAGSALSHLHQTRADPTAPTTPSKTQSAAHS
jgi:TPR repeat protein